MNLKLLFSVLLLITMLIPWGNQSEKHNPAGYAYPHHINISWASDPTTSQSVNWRTDEWERESDSD